MYDTSIIQKGNFKEDYNNVLYKYSLITVLRFHVRFAQI